MHHAREPLGLTMIILMIRYVLLGLQEKGRHNKYKEFFRDNMIFIIPVVNTDSYIYINKNWEHSRYS